MCVQLISLLLRALGVFFLVAGRLRRGVVICISLPFYQLHQLWVLKHCLYCGCVCVCGSVCVHVCAIDLPFTKSFRCVFLVAGRLRRGVVICISLPFYQLHQLWVLKHCLYCVCVCVFMCVQLISLLLRALGVFF